MRNRVLDLSELSGVRFDIAKEEIFEKFAVYSSKKTFTERLYKYNGFEVQATDNLTLQGILDYDEFCNPRLLILANERPKLEYKDFKIGDEVLHRIFDKGIIVDYFGNNVYSVKFKEHTKNILSSFLSVYKCKTQS